MLPIVELAGLTETFAKRIIERLRNYHGFEEILELQHLYYPEDVPIIQYQKAENVYAPLNEISVGQKCTALLIIALSEGTIPVLIDQPEDALDIVSVWQDVGKRLLDGKQIRQFIFNDP